MSEKIDLPTTIPIFTLPKAVLLPRSRLPLHIFEPRYLAMVEDCLKTPHRLIGMLQPTGDEGRLHTIGCAGKLTQFSETEDGRYMITLTGISRYRLDSEIEGFAPEKNDGKAWDKYPRDPWTASMDQAIMIRDQLLQNGVRTNYIKKIVGYGDKHRVPSDATNKIDQSVSIIIRNKK